MSKQSLQVITAELFEKTKKIRLTEVAALQSTANQRALQDLQQKAGMLAGAAKAAKPQTELLALHEQTVAALDTAGLLGIISNEELTQYYTYIDDIWTAIEGSAT